MHPNKQKEIKRLERVLMQRPKDSKALFDLGVIFYLEENMVKTKEIFLKLITSMPPFNLGAYFYLGRVSEAS